jgi:hypothetical protein
MHDDPMTLRTVKNDTTHEFDTVGTETTNEFFPAATSFGSYNDFSA